MLNMSKLRKENILVKIFLYKSLEKSQKMKLYDLYFLKYKEKLAGDEYIPRSNRVKCQILPLTLKFEKTKREKQINVFLTNF